MSLRRILLRVMLWCLGLAAGFGVLAVLLSWDETAWRIIGTMAVTAAAAALLMGSSWMSERKKWAAAGLFGMALVLAEWLMAMILIWELPEIFSTSPWRWEERVGLTMLTGLVGLWAMAGLWASGYAPSRAAGRFTSVVAAVCSAIWLMAVWDWPGWHTFHLFESGWVIAGFGALATLMLLDFAPSRWWTWAGLLAALSATFLAVGSIWQDWRGGGGGFEAIVSISVLAAFWSLIRLVHVGRTARWLKAAVLALAWITTVAMDLMIVMDYQQMNADLLGRLATSAGILTGCGTLALLVLARLGRKAISPGEMPNITAITLVCPVCGKRATGDLGSCICRNCGMGFRVELREPRCKSCNYLLLMLRADRCPECGTPVTSPLPQPVPVAPPPGRP